MKFFTPELHVRTCSTNDKVADAAHAGWERALDRYEKHLAKIRATFSPGVRRLTDELRLHDAQLLYLGTCDDRCSLALQTEGGRASIVTLDYSLATRPAIDRDVLPPKMRTGKCLFLYDEIDIAKRNGRRLFSHSILFTDGLLLRLRFHDVAVQVVDSLLETEPTAFAKPA